jgi:hypothetical protein
MQSTERTPRGWACQSRQSWQQVLYPATDRGGNANSVTPNRRIRSPTSFARRRTSKRDGAASEHKLGKARELTLSPGIGGGALVSRMHNAAPRRRRAPISHEIVTEIASYAKTLRAHGPRVAEGMRATANDLIRASMATRITVHDARRERAKRRQIATRRPEGAKEPRRGEDLLRPVSRQRPIT